VITRAFPASITRIKGNGAGHSPFSFSAVFVNSDEIPRSGQGLY
jgi:hypothetical protein